MFRFLALIIPAFAVLAWSFFSDPDAGADTLARLEWLSWVFVFGVTAYLLRRALKDGARSRLAYQVAMQSPTGAGLVFLGLCMLTGSLVMVMSGRANASQLPPNAEKYLPVLRDELRTNWPDVPIPSVMAAMVEQETCYRLDHPKCWSPTVELKTQREYGFGLYQHTRAYREDGSTRFDAWAESRAAHGSALAAWTWERRYDPSLQLRAGVLDMKACQRRIAALVPDGYNQMAMCGAAHNGGYGGLLSDRRLCAKVAGCDPDLWFGHVAVHSNKSRVKWKGYGASAFDINRAYVENVMVHRRHKYATWFGERAA
ncbi:MAG: lytic murein transglycosylase [Anaerolineae bacterium]|jgi:hypothetical protein|nr:lytic murein transglycosylase [Anaerolineae bacterium]